MARNQGIEKAPKGDEKMASRRSAPRSLALATNGIRTSHDFANLMSALMSDLIEGTVAPNVGNATCNAGGKLLRIVELQYKYGTANADNTKTLILAVPADNPIAAQSAQHR